MSHPCCDGVIAANAQASSLSSRWRCSLVAMALLPLPVLRCLAVVNDDGDGATGDSIDDNYGSVMNVNNDGDGTTDDDIDNNDCDGQRLR